MKHLMIQMDKVKKEFRDTLALNEVSFTIEEGVIFGLLGPSGSGKTTTINILTGQITADKNFRSQFKSTNRSRVEKNWLSHRQQWLL